MDGQHCTYFYSPPSVFVLEDITRMTDKGFSYPFPTTLSRGLVPFPAK